MPTPLALSQRDDGLLLCGEAVAWATGAITLGPERIAGARELGIYVTFSETAVGGAVVIETAASVGHAGPWHRLALVEWQAKGKASYVSVPGAHLAIRIRVDKPIINGTVTVHAVGN